MYHKNLGANYSLPRHYVVNVRQCHDVVKGSTKIMLEKCRRLSLVMHQVAGRDLPWRREHGRGPPWSLQHARRPVVAPGDLHHWRSASQW